MTTWLPVPGYEGLYEVSPEGEVRSLPRASTKGRILKQHSTPPGYLTVKIWKEGVGKTHRVHALVMLAYRGPRPEGQVVRHLNGDHLDNRLVNLDYGTYRENNLDAVRHGTNANSRKTHCKRGHELAGDNLIIGASGRGCRACARQTKRARYLRIIGGAA